MNRPSKWNKVNRRPCLSASSISQIRCELDTVKQSSKALYWRSVSVARVRKVLQPSGKNRAESQRSASGEPGDLLAVNYSVNGRHAKTKC